MSMLYPLLDVYNSTVHFLSLGEHNRLVKSLLKRLIKNCIWMFSKRSHKHDFACVYSSTNHNVFHFVCNKKWWLPVTESLTMIQSQGMTDGLTTKNPNNSKNGSDMYYHKTVSKINQSLFWKTMVQLHPVYYLVSVFNNYNKKHI